MSEAKSERLQSWQRMLMRINVILITTIQLWIW